MSELLRTFTTRAVEILCPNNINLVGNHSHPLNYQSDRFKSWKLLCKENNVLKLNSEMTAFLLGKDSIEKVDDLGLGWSIAITEIRALGKEINKEKAYKIIKDAKLETFFEKEKGIYTTQRTAIADTILCLSYFKNLSHSGNMDYLSTFKVMTFVERCFDYKMELPELNINKFFDKQVVIPSCFSKLDLCNIVVTQTPFPFIETKSNQRVENKLGGCTSNNCVCKVDDNCVPQSKCCAKPRIDVIDLLVVKDYTKCYQAGDLSFIKNVLEGETLTTKNRYFERTEELVETQTDIRQFEEKYLQTEDKASLQRETESIVKQDSAFDAGVTVNAHGESWSVDANAKYSSSNSKTDTNKVVVNSSKDIVDRATKQVEEKMRKLVSTKRILENKEINTHTFNNVDGGNISGQYLYVNKISRAQVFNYGRKAVIDLVLPEPAALYKKLLKNDFQGKKPSAPILINIDPKTITPITYQALILQYGLKDVPKPPDFVTVVEVTLQGTPGEGDHIVQFPCSIPANYSGESMTVNPVQLNYIKDGGVSIKAILGSIGNSVSHSKANNLSSYTSTLPSIEGSNNVTVETWDVKEFTWLLAVKCELKEEFKLQWRTEVYNKIKEKNDASNEKYNKDLADFQKAKDDFDQKEADAKKERYNKDPFINRETEKAELKRMVIAYISCQFFDQFNAMKNKVEPCGYPEMNIREAEQEGKFVEFFEQAFNWNLITYLFYPYFWGKKCTWSDKLKEEPNDLIFKKFLEAGSCRVLVPIRDGYFDYVHWFLTYGEIWGGSDTTPLTDDPHYVSLAQEIKEQKQNFNADREGSLDVTNGSNTVVLNNSDHYGILGAASTSIDLLNIASDIDREIIIDCKVYRIVSIAQQTVGAATSWVITLERKYEGITQTNLKWSTGAVFVGAPWEFVTPTTLTFLRKKSSCLPCYPLEECKEG